MDSWLPSNWLVIAAVSAPLWGTMLWVYWEVDVRPRLIPMAEIEAEASAMLERWGERAAEMALMEEHAAWFRSHISEQGRWHRIRVAIERMTKEGV